MRTLRVVATVAVVVAVVSWSRETDSADFTFTHAPAAFSDIAGIEPLGGLNPGIEYDPAPFEAPQCALLPPELPDDSWATYVR